MPDAHVVVLTMHADSDLVEKARSAGAAGYLLKDASGEEVVAGRTPRHRGPADDLGRDRRQRRPRSCPATRRRRREDAPSLTEREVQILQMLADGCTPAEVAERLFISPKTVRNHLTKVYDKLDVNSRSAAIVVGLQHHLIELPEG